METVLEKLLVAVDQGTYIAHSTEPEFLYHFLKNPWPFHVLGHMNPAYSLMFWVFLWYIWILSSVLQNLRSNLAQVAMFVSFIQKVSGSISARISTILDRIAWFSSVRPDTTQANTYNQTTATHSKCFTIHIYIYMCVCVYWATDSVVK
jgi:hypothetical protein